MKHCPECGRTFSAADDFCSEDGAVLIDASATAAIPEHQAPAPSEIRCPACGGRAVPGEAECVFCGTKLPEAIPTAPPAEPPTQEGQNYSEGYKAAYEEAHQQDYQPFSDVKPSEPEPARENRLFTFLSYSLAGIVGIVAAVWLVSHLRPPAITKPKPQVSIASIPPTPAVSVSPAPSVASPDVVILESPALIASGEATSDAARSLDAARQAFETGKAKLLDLYQKKLKDDPAFRDAMLLDVFVNPDGSVASAAVKISTALDLAFDNDAVAAVTSWRWMPITSGLAEFIYPLSFAGDPGGRTEVGATLATKAAQIKPDQLEFAMATPTPAAAGPVVASVAPPEKSLAPEAAPSEEAAPEEPKKEEPKERRSHKRKRSARSRVEETPEDSGEPAKESTGRLEARVAKRLHGSPRLRRVRVSASNGVVTLSGQVFDEGARGLAIQETREVDGVAEIIDSMNVSTTQWAQLQQRVNAHLHNAGLPQVEVEIIGSDAYLKGQVTTPEEKSRAVQITESDAPVTVRTNLIRIVPGDIFGF